MAGVKGFLACLKHAGSKWQITCNVCVWCVCVSFAAQSGHVQSFMLALKVRGCLVKKSEKV